MNYAELYKKLVQISKDPIKRMILEAVINALMDPENDRLAKAMRRTIDTNGEKNHPSNGTQPTGA